MKRILCVCMSTDLFIQLYLFDLIRCLFTNYCFVLLACPGDFCLFILSFVFHAVNVRAVIFLSLSIRVLLCFVYEKQNFWMHDNLYVAVEIAHLNTRFELITTTSKF